VLSTIIKTIFLKNKKLCTATFQAELPFSIVLIYFAKKFLFYIVLYKEGRKAKSACGFLPQALFACEKMV
jgi:hypothetical protein